MGLISACEYVEGHQVHLGVAVLASLGGGHLHNLARTVLVIDALKFNIENPIEQQHFIINTKRAHACLEYTLMDYSGIDYL